MKYRIRKKIFKRKYSIFCKACNYKIYGEYDGDKCVKHSYCKLKRDLKLK